MKKILIIFCLFVLLGNNTYGNENYFLLENFKKISNNKIIFMRHALAPGNGDPSNFNIDDCSTKRNLDINVKVKIFKNIQLIFW